jgi:hypothetical protein
MPAAAHSLSDSTRKPASAASWRARNLAMVTWSGVLVDGQHAECDVLVAASFELPRRAHAQTVAVKEHAEQELGIIGGMAVSVITVGQVEGCEVKLVDHVEDEPGEMAFREPVTQVRGQQEGLVAVTAQEALGHGW